MADTLTNRQAEILSLFREGKTYEAVAVLLGISEETVRKHAYNIYKALKVSNKMEAVNKYYGQK